MLIGIIGKSNVGKSTFFKALTLSNIEIEDRPFVTISPNRGYGHVKIPDVANEFNKKSNPREGYVLERYRFVPIELLDVAGLVPEAHKGKGMGNQFLDDLNQANALIHVIDISGSTDEKGNPVPVLSYNPSNDIRFLELELDMWYLRILKRGWEKFSKKIIQEKLDINKALAKQMSGLRVTEEIVKESIKDLPNNLVEWKENDLLKLASELRKKTKPTIIAANKIDVPGSEENFNRIIKEFPSYIIIPCSAESELALKEASRNGLIKYILGENNFKIVKKLNSGQYKGLELIEKNVLSKYNSTGIQKIIDTIVFDVLDYIAVHPGGVSRLEDSSGNTLPDCYLMRSGSTALDFAYKIHRDLGERFIKAINVRDKKPVGKEYKLKHLDILEIKTKK